MQRQVQTAKTNVPTIEGVDPVLAAEMLRKEWKMGDGAIPNLLALLESHGIRIFFAGEIGNEVDAFSYWEPKTQCPYVFLTTSKSGERRRMDAAHELGHLVMHRNLDMGPSATKRNRSRGEQVCLSLPNAQIDYAEIYAQRLQSAGRSSP